MRHGESQALGNRSRVWTDKLEKVEGRCWNVVGKRVTEACVWSV